jgi:hypothetical protein
MTMKRRLPGHFASAGLLAVGVAAGMALAPTVSIQAQGGKAAMIESLIGNETDVPDSGGLILRAPLTVLGADGMPLLEVDDSGMIFHQRTVGAASGFSVNYGSTPVAQAYSSGENKGSLVALTNGQMAAEIGVGGQSNKGFIILRENGTDFITLGGKFRSLRILENDKERVVVGDDQGSMGIHAKTDQGIATVGLGKAGFGLFLKDPGGQPTADIMQPQGKGMALRVYDGGKDVAAVGNVPGEGGSVRIFAPGAPKASVSLQTDDGGTGLVHVYGPGGKEAVLLEGRTASIAIDGDGGSAKLGVAEAGADTGFGALGSAGGSAWGLFIGNDGSSPQAEIADHGKGMALRIFQGGSQLAAIGNVSGKGGAVRVADNGGNAVATMTEDGGAGLVQVYKAGAPLLALAGKDSAVSVYNSSGISVASLGLSGNQSGGNLTTRDGSGSGVFSAGAASDGGGEACVNRVRGDGKLLAACLGLGLPSMGLGK